MITVACPRQRYRCARSTVRQANCAAASRHIARIRHACMCTNCCANPWPLSSQDKSIRRTLPKAVVMHALPFACELNQLEALRLHTAERRRDSEAKEQSMQDRLRTLNFRSTSLSAPQARAHLNGNPPSLQLKSVLSQTTAGSVSTRLSATWVRRPRTRLRRQTCA